MRFAHPWFFLLLLVIIPIYFRGHSTGGRFRFSSLDIIKKIKGNTRFHPRQILIWLRILVVIFFVLALARPQQGKKFTEISSEGVDIMLLLDTSGSMHALDFERDGKRINRLAIIKEVVAKFIDKRPNDRMGLVVFGDDAFTQCPLTLDHGILLELLSKVEIGMAGESTAIGSAMGVGANRMKDLKAKSKIMILLTDGRNNAGQLPPAKVSEVAKSLDLKIYTIGVGTHGKAPFLTDTIFGQRYVYQDVDIDEDTLKSIADETNGKYYRATQTAELEQIYDEIDRLEKTEITSKTYTEYNELFAYFVLLGIFILLAEIVLGQTILRKIP
ncbi:MAG: aerotolerance regulator BatA [Bdellovibrionales bacterium GWA2_49_15]|nr:MAG: aerotolerance regulator BatA [Bdellovibrionales bacterium GWA2_49_15]HAZ12332.1 aerotolerance regulator BatA [Bdellovibrionales bacterium]